MITPFKYKGPGLCMMRACDQATDDLEDALCRGCLAETPSPLGQATLALWGFIVLVWVGWVFFGGWL